MPKLSTQQLSAEGVEAAPFVGFKGDWFPSSGSGPLSIQGAWPGQQLAALDSMQRALTIGMFRSTGIPTLASLADSQVDFLGTLPALDPVSPIASALQDAVARGKGPEAAFKIALEVINGLGLEALQGFSQAVNTAVGTVKAVPMIGAIVQLAVSYGQTYYAAFKKVDSGPARAPFPVYDADSDAAACQIFYNATGTRDWTGLFSPADHRIPLASDEAPRNITAKSWSREAPHFAGRRLDDSRDYFAYAQWEGTGTSLQFGPNTQQHFGLVPLWEGYGGRLWRGVIVPPSRNATPVGDALPTAQATGLAMWRTVFNPLAPQVFFVDSVRLGNEYLNYLVQLRRGLHLSHHPKALDFLQAWTGSSKDTASRLAARLWLSFSKVEKGDLKKRKALRRAACDAMAPIFGWKKWSSQDDKMVANIDKVMGVSDDDYIDLFDLNQAACIRACRGLYHRQREAAQSSTVVYSRIDDPAFTNSSELRYLRGQTMRNLVGASEAISLVDADMMQQTPAGYAATQLSQGGQLQGLPQAAPGIKARAGQLPDVWVGDGPVPRSWAGQDPGGGLKTGGASGGGGVVVLGAAAAAAALFAFGGLR